MLKSGLLGNSAKKCEAEMNKDDNSATLFLLVGFVRHDFLFLYLLFVFKSNFKWKTWVIIYAT